MSLRMGQKSIRLGLGSLRVSSVSRSSSGWTIGAEGQDHAACPQCRTRSRSRHSFYRRRVRDLPIQGVPVLIDLKVSRWRCRKVGCEQKIFVERLPSVAPAHARISERLAGIVEVLKEASPDFVRMRALAMRFRGVLRGGSAGKLEDWIRDAKSSGIYARFCRKNVTDRSLPSR